MDHFEALNKAESAIQNGKCKAALVYFEIALRRGATPGQAIKVRKKFAKRCFR
jgi:hypothetical protein